MLFLCRCSNSTEQYFSAQPKRTLNNAIFNCYDSCLYFLPRSVWIGLTDSATESLFVWPNGELLSWEDWFTDPDENVWQPGGGHEEVENA